MNGQDLEFHFTCRPAEGKSFHPDNIGHYFESLPDGSTHIVLYVRNAIPVRQGAPLPIFWMCAPKMTTTEEKHLRREPRLQIQKPGDQEPGCRSMYPEFQTKEIEQEYRRRAENIMSPGDSPDNGLLLDQEPDDPHID
jgi:hypothetical protein